MCVADPPALEASKSLARTSQIWTPAHPGASKGRLCARPLRREPHVGIRKIMLGMMSLIN